MSWHDYQKQLWDAPEPFRWLRDRGLTEDTIWEARLGYRADTNAVTIPYFDARGEFVTERYRFLAPRDHKYESMPGGGMHLYGVEHVDHPRPFLVEGEFDALVLRQEGHVAIGLPGATAWQRQWRWLFRNCDVVNVIFDGDAATNENVRKGRNKVTGSLSNVVEIRLIELPEGMDVTDLYVAGRLGEVL